MIAIRLLESDANARGDLFCRLMTSFFSTLGYGEFLLNVQKSGREIDVQGRHVTEKHLLRAECKAESSPIGGSLINKFVGVLDVERRVKKTTIEGYFVSLSGFTGPALEQEEEAGGDRVILETGNDVVERLIAALTIVRPDVAADAARNFAANELTDDLMIVGDPGLVALQDGWFWEIRYGDGKSSTHAVFVHSDGSIATTNIAEGIIAADKECGGLLYRLRLAAPPPPGGDRIESARRMYYDYLSRECGAISFEGLPADEGVSSKNLRLEDIYVPREFSAGGDNQSSETREISEPDHDDEEAPDVVRLRSLGDILASQERLAILGPPGAGKSTLLKRVAIGYAFAERRIVGEEALPDVRAVPLLIRCRQLNSLARVPILDVIHSIGRRAELGDLNPDFSIWTDQAVREGTAWLLVDGLDEISDEQARMSFVQQLRTFLGTYPNVRAIITSRDFGFRLVAGVVSEMSYQTQIAPLSMQAISDLTVAWYRQALGDSMEHRATAQKVADEIAQSAALRGLASNPPF